MRAIPLGFALLVGCASSPVQEPTTTYTIPVIKSNGSVQHFTVEPDSSTEKMLFCVESPQTILCVSEDQGRVLRYYFPIPKVEPQV